MSLFAAMAEEDLNLSDALTDSVPRPGVESMVEKDFVAQLEAETFDDQVKEMVEKSDYVPLLDNDDTRPGETDIMLKICASVVCHDHSLSFFKDSVTFGHYFRL